MVVLNLGKIHCTRYIVMDTDSDVKYVCYFHNF